MKYYFNDYVICTNTYELQYKGKVLKIEPLVFKLLKFMLENPDRVLSRDELIKKVWDARVVSDSALSATISFARNAIGDSGREQKYIKTVSGTGYRFIATFTTSKNKPKKKTCSPFSSKHLRNDIELLNIQSQIATLADINKLPHNLSLPDKPSIAIMDFINQSTQQGGNLLAQGLCCDINSALARLPHFFVIARASSAKASQQNLSAKEAGLCLGVRYLVYATIQLKNKRIRVTVSLVDSTTDTEIWAEYYNHSVDDLFLVQDDISSAITVAIDSFIEQAEIERAFLTSTENLSSWENYHRGLHYMNQTTSKGVDKAQHYFKQALVNDDKFSRANAGLAYTYISRKLLNNKSSSDEDNIIHQAFKYGQLSIDYGKHDAMGYLSLGRAFYFTSQYKKSMSVIEQGLQLNTNSVSCVYFKAMCTTVLDQQDAQPYFDLAEQLSPLDPLLFSINMTRAIFLVQSKKYNEAVSYSLSATCYPNAYFTTYAVAAACLQLAGHAKQAQQYTNKVLALKPDYSIELYKALTPHGSESARTVIVMALRKTGIPEKSPPSINH